MNWEFPKERCIEKLNNLICNVFLLNFIFPKLLIMKKLIPFFLLTFIVFSCSDSDDSGVAIPIIDTSKLAKVIFDPKTPSEKHWNFYPNGLLKEITKPDGTILQNFVYDAKNNLLSSSIIAEPYNSHKFTYNNTNFVAMIDDEKVNYDSTLDAFYTGVLGHIYRLTKINTEKLLIDGKLVHIEIENGISYESEFYQISVNYLNHNISSYSQYNETCHFFTYDKKTNPLRDATLPICKAFGFVSNSEGWINGHYNSVNNVLTEHYCSEDPESNTYNYTYNSHNLPNTRTSNYYFRGVFENSKLSAIYYYQGDVIPQ